MNKEWIKIQDQEPEEGQKCWTCHDIWDREKYTVEAGIFYHPEPDERCPGMENEQCFAYPGSGFLCGDVTHWMPYEEGVEPPEPPRKEINNEGIK